MNITKDVVLDLLPVYLAGEASADTRALVEEYLTRDPDLAQRVRHQSAKGLGSTPATTLPLDLELRALKRTHRQIWLQTLLFALMVVSLGAMMALKFTFGPGGLREVHTHPLAPWCLLIIGVASGLAFLRIRLGLRRVLGRR
jgi:hypothetical protein